MGKILQLPCFSSPKGCGWADISVFVNSFLKVMIVIGMFVAAIMISYAGWTLLRGMGEPAARSKARHILISVVIGLIILFGAYFIVDLILTKLQVDQDIRQMSL